MKEAKLPLPEIAAIGATRGMLGAGIGLLLAGKVSDRNRKWIGWPLLAIGAISTVPLAMDIFRKIDRGIAPSPRKQP